MTNLILVILVYISISMVMDSDNFKIHFILKFCILEATIFIKIMLNGELVYTFLGYWLDRFPLLYLKIFF